MRFRDFLLRTMDEALQGQIGPAQRQIYHANLIPVNSRGEVKSSFDSTQPVLRSFAFGDPTGAGLAGALIFCVMTAHSQQSAVYRAWPTVMGILEAYFQNRKATAEGIEQVILRHDKPGDSISTVRDAVYGSKLGFIADLWNNRQRHMAALSELAAAGKEDPVKAFDYIHQNIKGLGVVKSAFAVQILMGKLGCLDIQNYYIYQSYFKQKERLGRMSRQQRQKMTQDINPAEYGNVPKSAGSPTRAKAVQRYLKALEALEVDGIGSKQMWDIWVNVVGEKYPIYNPGLFSTWDEDDPGIDKVKGVVATDSEGNKAVVQKSPRSGAVSLTHRLDLMHPKQVLDPALATATADNPEQEIEKHPILNVRNPDHRQVVKNPQQRYFHPLLYWTGKDRRLQDYLQLGPEKKERLKDAFLRWRASQ